MQSFDVKQGRTRPDAHGYPPFTRWALLFGGVLAALVGVAAGIMRGAGSGVGAAVLAAAAVMVLLLPVLLPTQLELGADGMSFSRWGYSWFVPFEDVVRLERGLLATNLVLKDGRRLRLVNGDQLELGEAIGDIEDALTAYRERQGEAPQVDVGRGQDSRRQWLERLRALASPEHRYREAPPNRAELLSAAADPRAEPTARAGAAALLHADLAQDERARLRIAADETASPRLRIALEAALDPEAEQEAVEQAAVRVKPRKHTK